MFISELKLWNFRKYGVNKTEGQPDQPGLTLLFNPGLNLLVGENDSGKTSIIDAIKLVLLTHSREHLRLDYEDFHIPQGKTEEQDRAPYLRIDCIFRGFKNEEAKNFLEWLGIEEDATHKKAYWLQLSLKGRRSNRNAFYDVRAGVDEEGSDMAGEARDLLRTTYLKPLRDAESELMSGRRSRLPQILLAHEAFAAQDVEHTLVTIIKRANQSIRNYFKGVSDDGNSENVDKAGEKVLKEINTYLEEFFTEGEKKQAGFSITDPELKSILEKLELTLLETKVGLGSMNRLFMAAELLLLKRGGYTGLRLALIEEAEAHLHPQAQLRLIEYLQEEVSSKSSVQLILTSHSPNLASKVKLKNLILCKNNNAFPMDPLFTMLEKGDYSFLERFLDTTKANLFFAQGVILVEGDAESLLLPSIARIIGRDLSKYGVSIVNIGSTAFLRYSRIFKRTGTSSGLGIPVACITDNDIRPVLYKTEVDPTIKAVEDFNKEELKQHRASKISAFDGQGVRTFISPNWTLEYDICLGRLAETIYEAVLRAEKIQNSDRIGLTDAKAKEVSLKVRADFDLWKESKWGDGQVAFEIYQRTLKARRISKAIVAQSLAELLESKERGGIRDMILADPQWAYIVDAINYATGAK